MITKLIKNLSAIAAVALAMTSCGSGETFSMASEEGIAKVKELVSTHVDTAKYKIYEVAWAEDNRDRKLENILSQVNVYYTDPEDNNYSLYFYLENGEFTTDGPKKSDRKINSFELSTPLDLNKINPDFIRTISEAAIALVNGQEDGDNYELKSVEKYRFCIDPVNLHFIDSWKSSEETRKEHEQMNVRFELNYVDKDEPAEYQGRFKTINYYTIPFIANEAGEVAFDE